MTSCDTGVPLPVSLAVCVLLACQDRNGPRHDAPARFNRSANRHAVLQTALGPQGVDAASDLQRAARTHVALENLAVVAGGLDDVDHPVVRHAEVGADLGF